MRRVYVTAAILHGKQPGQVIELAGDRAHYLRDVLRLQPADPVELFDGQGTIARTEVIALGDLVRLKITALKDSQRGESPLDIVLYQAIPKGKRWEWLLEKVTELGVATIVPLASQRTVVHIAGDRLDHKMARWNKKLAAAARQCGRAIIPTLERPQTIKEARERSRCQLHLLAHLMDQPVSLQSALAEVDEQFSSVGLWIGPEGGFSDAEVSAQIDGGARPINLGPRILRTDTAAISAVALTQAMAGDFR